MRSQKRLAQRIDYAKWIGIGITLIGFVGACAVAFYKINEHDKSIALLWQSKAQKEFVAEKMADFKVDQQDIEQRVRELEKRRR